MDGAVVCPAYFIMTWEKNIKLKLFASISRGEGEEEEKENIRITSDGVMTQTGDRVEICYEEFLEEEGVLKNTLSFLLSDRNVVTLIREGAISNVMTFSENGRYNGLYHSSLATFHMTVATKHVENKISFEKGGVLLLLYNTEVQGVPLQSSRFRFEIICSEDAVFKQTKTKK